MKVSLISSRGLKCIATSQANIFMKFGSKTGVFHASVASTVAIEVEFLVCYFLLDMHNVWKLWGTFAWRVFMCFHAHGETANNLCRKIDRNISTGTTPRIHN